VIALLADRQRDGKAVARRREWAGRVRSVGARRIFQAIEIEHQLAGLIEAVGGEAGIEKSAGTVSGRGAGRVAKYEEEFCNGRIFKDGLQPKSFFSKREFRGAGNGLIVAGADEGGESDRLLRGIHLAVTRYRAFGAYHFSPWKPMRAGE
jgi:hypothetical protein